MLKNEGIYANRQIYASSRWLTCGEVYTLVPRQKLKLIALVADSKSQMESTLPTFGELLLALLLMLQKSSGYQLRLVFFSIIYKGFIHPFGGCLGFPNHQQYVHLRGTFFLPFASLHDQHRKTKRLLRSKFTHSILMEMWMFFHPGVVKDGDVQEMAGKGSSTKWPSKNGIILVFWVNWCEIYFVKKKTLFCLKHTNSKDLFLSLTYQPTQIFFKTKTFIPKGHPFCGKKTVKLTIHEF